METHASTGWYRDDGALVAYRLARAIGRDPRATDLTSALRRSGFSVTFAVTAASAVEAHETASRVLRLAWAALNVEANAGDDYDISNVTTEPL